MRKMGRSSDIRAAVIDDLTFDRTSMRQIAGSQK